MQSELIARTRNSPTLETLQHRVHMVSLCSPGKEQKGCLVIRWKGEPCLKKKKKKKARSGCIVSAAH